MWLPWPPALALALVLWAGVWATRPRARPAGDGETPDGGSADGGTADLGTADGGTGGRRLIAARTFATELGLVLALYSLWRIAGTISIWDVDGAIDRGRSIWDLEQAIHLPSELQLQQVFLEHPLWIQAANVYYAVAHVPAIIVVLLWAFIGHRDRYGRVRNVLAGVTAACLVVQLVAVAPPRMFPDLGFVDSGHLYGQSVYTAVGTGVSDQLSAMPSVHIAWAVLVGAAAVLVGSSRWRWLVLAHPVLTFVVVVATANHWWLDGIVAAAILALAALADDRARAWLAVRQGLDLRVTAEAGAPPESVSEPVREPAV